MCASAVHRLGAMYTSVQQQRSPISRLRASLSNSVLTHRIRTFDHRNLLQSHWPIGPLRFSFPFHPRINPVTVTRSDARGDVLARPGIEAHMSPARAFIELRILITRGCSRGFCCFSLTTSLLAASISPIQSGLSTIDSYQFIAGEFWGLIAAGPLGFSFPFHPRLS